MRLQELLKLSKVSGKVTGPDCEITGIASHSKKVKPGFLFIATRGENSDGHHYLDEAIKNGAQAVITEKDFPSLSNSLPNLTKVLVKHSKPAIAKIAPVFYARPAKMMKAFGVTGTNGKTTVTYLLEQIFKAAHYKIGVIGTVNYRLVDRVVVSSNTTPGVIELQELLTQMLQRGARAVVMEVSSHALVQDRTEGINFSCAAFTNLGREHLDYHLNMENYFLAKAKLFANLDKEAKAVINLDDPYGKKLLKMTKAQIIRVSLKRKNADIFADNIDLSTEGLRFLLKTPSGSIEIKSSLVGLHNVYNIMIAAGLALSEKIEMKIIQQGIAALEKVPGRLEAVNFGQPFKVFVDYAHTPDALKNILEFLRKLAPKRMIAVFGCGGDRDRGKRPLMAKVAAQFCDAIVITSDNPRSEDPEKIAQEITRGIPKDFSHYKVILDRRQAIAEAINSAEPNDIVVIAGKGHERFQIFKDSRIPFDDIEVARDLINQEKICLNSAK